MSEVQFFQRICKLSFIGLLSLQTLFEAWKSSALSSAYMQKILADLSNKMLEIEANELAPPGWRANWDRYASPFFYPFYSIFVPSWTDIILLVGNFVMK